MSASKGVAAVALVVAGALGAFAGYAVGSRDGGAGRADTAGVGAGAAPRTYVLRDGDVALRREAATRCTASQEAGAPNLFCTRIGEGRHDVVFYGEVVQVWPHGRGPDEPPASYRWEP